MLIDIRNKVLMYSNMYAGCKDDVGIHRGKDVEVTAQMTCSANKRTEPFVSDMKGS